MQEPQQPVIRSRVTMVPLDVRVVDRNGVPITDLTQRDFTVLEDGLPQAITHFAVHQVAPDPAAAALPLEFSSRTAERAAPPSLQNRRVIFVLLTRGRHNAFKYIDALADFIGGTVMPQDTIAVTAWNRTTDFTTDHARLRRIVLRYRERHERIETLMREWFSGLRARSGRPTIPPHIQKHIDWVFEEAADIRQAPVQGGHPGLAEFIRRAGPPWVYTDTFKLVTGVNYLRHVVGEKRVLVLTERGAGVPRPHQGRGIAAMAANARIAIDIIQTGGTIGAAPARFAGPISNRRIVMPVAPSFRAVSDFVWNLRDLRETSEETGGHAVTLKTGPEAFRRLAAATGSYYALGYYPANTTWDGTFRAIAVKVTRPGARVLVRRGYFAADSSTPLDLRDFVTFGRMREATDDDRPFEGIGVALTNLKAHGPDRHELEADLKLDLSRVSAAEEGGLRLVSIDVAILCTGAGNRLVGELRRRVDLKVTAERWQRIQEEGLVVTLRVPLTGAAENLKAIAYEYAGDNLGSLAVRLQR